MSLQENHNQRRKRKVNEPKPSDLMTRKEVASVMRCSVKTVSRNENAYGLAYARINGRRNPVMYSGAKVWEILKRQGYLS